jgi:hypothetical protein
VVSGISPPDPFVLRAFGASDNFAGISYKTTAGLTVRSPAINPALKTLVLITAGQSLWANTTPTAFVPTNSAVVDQMNIFDGAIYSIAGPLMGSTLNTGVGSPGYGNVSARVADTLVTNAKFDRVIIVSTAIGSTTASMWGDTTGDLYNRLPVVMARLASRGIVPGMTGVTFACVWGIGEQDNGNGTTQAAFAASASSFISTLQATGFNGRIFIPQETWNGGATSANVRAAQASLWGGSVFSGGDMDTLNNTNRADTTHWNDTGAAAATTIMYNAMHASGAPY